MGESQVRKAVQNVRLPVRSNKRRLNEEARSRKRNLQMKGQSKTDNIDN